MQEVSAFQEDAMTDYRVVGVAGDDQNTGFRPRLADVIQQTSPIGFGHHNVRNQDGDLLGMVICSFDDGWTVVKQ